LEDKTNKNVTLNNCEEGRRAMQFVSSHLASRGRRKQSTE